jgi:glycosyltransferase involved in cell wall biosynthesis
MNHLDRLFALSPGVKQVYAHNHVNSDLIDVVPNFYDPSFTAQSETECDILSDEFTILYVGRLRAAKGVDLLVDAARQLDMSDTAINIVGEGPLREELEAKTERHNLGASIRFHEWIDQLHLPKYYEQSNVFIHPGRWPEPFGRTILEALQHDCPPIVSSIGAPPWIIREAGEKFKLKDSMDLTNEVEKMRTDSELSSHTNKCSSRLERFDPKYIVPAIESRYQID